jgi:hypothetical protein
MGWYLNDKLHRVGNPAIKWKNGNEKWCVHGEIHREDGPALDLLYMKEWWLHCEKLTESEFNQWLEKKNLNEKLNNTLKEKNNKETINKI